MTHMLAGRNLRDIYFDGRAPITHFASRAFLFISLSKNVRPPWRGQMYIFIPPLESC